MEIKVLVKNNVLALFNLKEYLTKKIRFSFLNYLIFEREFIIKAVLLIKKELEAMGVRVSWAKLDSLW